MTTKTAKRITKARRAKFCTEAGRGLRRRVPEGGSRLARCRWGAIPRANPTHDVFDYEAAGPGGTKIPFRLSVRGLLKPSRMTMGSGTEPFTAIGQFSLRRAEDAFDDPMDVGEDGFLEVLSGYVDDRHQLHAWTRSMDPEDAPLERSLRNRAQRALDAALRSQNPGGATTKRRARSNPASRRGRANPFSPADVALLGANVAAVGGIAYSFALDKKSKVLDRAVLRETDRAGILRDTHLDRGPEGRKYVSTPDLKALADPHVYTRAWDARKRDLLEQLRTGDYEIRRTGEHQWYFTRPGEARGVHGPDAVHGAHGLPPGAQYPGLPAPSVYTDTLHGAHGALHGAHGAREHATVRSNPRATPRTTQRTTQRTTTGSRFDALVQEFERRGVRSPRGLAASIGRRKYGAKRFAAMSVAGKAHGRTSSRGKHRK